MEGRQTEGPQEIAPRRERKAGINASKQMLSPEQSVELRDRLLTELKDLKNGEEAAQWARCLSEKNKLATADAQRVEEVFAARLAALTQMLAQMLGKRRLRRELLRSP